MKNPFLLTPIILALLVAGCGQKELSTPTVSPPVTTTTAGPRVVEITANDTMKYSITRIEAKAREQLKIVLTNTGTQPKEVMGHNWVLLKAGSDAAAFSAAAVSAKDSNYIPPTLKDQIIANIDLLGPRKSGEVTFTVPAAGEYPFLCTFPAHFQVGMKGTLVVK
jgi:azurin